MPTVYDVDIGALNTKLASELKNKEEISLPESLKFVKTGAHKERPPVQEDWWFHRCAALLTSIYRLGPIGVSKLRTKYGGKKNRGHKPEAFRRCSGAIIRRALQQLEKAGLLAQTEKAGHKGRILTKEGISFVDKTAGTLYTRNNGTVHT
jgi:small subunit ribosomal protein S19e